MPRGRTAYEEAQIQGRLWTPHHLEPTRRGIWLDYTDPATLTIIGSAITAVADKWGRLSLSVFPSGLTFTQRFWPGSADLAGKYVTRGSIDGGGAQSGTTTNSVGFSGSISGHPLATATTITQVSLCYSETSAINPGLLTVRPQNNPDSNNWSSTFADFCSRQNNAFITGAGAGLVNVSPPQTTWYLYAQQVGVNGAGLNEVILDEGRRTGGSASGTVGTSNSARIRSLLASAGALGTDTGGWLGQCAEQVVLINATSADRQRVAGSIAWKHGLQAKVLPPSHPFANRPPLIGY